MIKTNYNKKSVLLFLPAVNFNEQEYLVISGTLQKAGINIFIVSDSNSLCIGSNGMKVKNDVILYNVHPNNFAGLIFIGGTGTRNYWNNVSLHSIAKKFSKDKRIIGAICSAPIILAKAGLPIKAATCFPEDKPELEKEGIEYKDCPVVSIDKIITGRDPLSTDEFIKSFLYELNK